MAKAKGRHPSAVCVLCALSLSTLLRLSRSRWSHVEDAVDAELFEKPPILGVYPAPDEQVVQHTRGSLVVAARAAHRAPRVLACPLDSGCAEGARKNLRAGRFGGGFFSKPCFFFSELDSRGRPRRVNTAAIQLNRPQVTPRNVRRWIAQRSQGVVS